MLAQEGKDFFPPVGRLLGTMGGAAGIEKSVPGSVVAVEFVGLSEPFQRRFGAVHLVGIGILIVIAEDAEQRRAQLLGQIARRTRPLAVELGFVVHDDIAAPTIDDSVEVRDAAPAQVGMATAGAEAD